MRINCWLFGCAYDPVDDSSPFECFRCEAVPEEIRAEDEKVWLDGLKYPRAIYRWLNGWRGEWIWNR